ncbi:hypothetical protein GQ55_5G266200 [Panicum hallii var. hallii]|uniref:Uncharacterized protein n=1 Tax=Panicum hallii var. hallii TaxID=1504633 RepID=A0A2T7DKG3_9POAL|nr:hypothetical protein GQ55_5G266200 [Panicum hallii var. hallii]
MAAWRHAQFPTDQKRCIQENTERVFFEAHIIMRSGCLETQLLLIAEAHMRLGCQCEQISSYTRGCVAL